MIGIEIEAFPIKFAQAVGLEYVPADPAGIPFKYEPRVTGNGCTYHLDGGAVEVAMPPTEDIRDQLPLYLDALTELYSSGALPSDVMLIAAPQWYVPDEVLNANPHLSIAGCTASENLYGNTPLASWTTNYRTAGVHISLDWDVERHTSGIVMALDVLTAVVEDTCRSNIRGHLPPPSLLEYVPYFYFRGGKARMGKASDLTMKAASYGATHQSVYNRLAHNIHRTGLSRRAVYGKAGEYRLKPFGLEYRTPSGLSLAYLAEYQDVIEAYRVLAEEAVVTGTSVIEQVVKTQGKRDALSSALSGDSNILRDMLDSGAGYPNVVCALRNDLIINAKRNATILRNRRAAA